MGIANDEIRVDKIELRTVPALSWMLDEPPLKAWEIWFLRPGRQGGEQLGWLGERHTGFEYKMMPGIAPAGGVCPTAHEAIGAMLDAMACNG